jgi:hypothetical protein
VRLTAAAGMTSEAARAIPNTHVPAERSSFLEFILASGYFQAGDNSPLI